MNNSLTVLASNWGKLEKKLLPSTHKQQIHTTMPILCNLYLYDHYTARLNISNFDQNNIPLLPKPTFGSCKAEGMFVSEDGKTHLKENFALSRVVFVFVNQKQIPLNVIPLPLPPRPLVPARAEGELAFPRGDLLLATRPGLARTEPLPRLVGLTTTCPDAGLPRAAGLAKIEGLPPLVLKRPDRREVEPG